MISTNPTSTLKILLSGDVPSDHEELGRADLAIWINESEEYPRGQVLWKHYEKPVASKKVVQCDSAINERSTRTIHTQDCIRIMRNSHIELPEKTKNEALGQYMQN